jgi:hypothetical protein
MAEKSAARHFAETILPAAGLGLVSGTNIFYDKAPHDQAISAPIVAVLNVGGLDPERNADAVHYVPTVQTLVVGAPGGYDQAEALIENIRNYIIKMVSITVGSTRYYGTFQQGESGFIKYDEENRPMFSANFRLFRTY